MPPGPSNLGDNRFADFATSPTRKKKKQSSKIFESFPELPKTKLQNPKYIVIACNEDKISMKDFSCFAIQRSLHVISKEIISISELRDGNLLLLVKDKVIAKKFLLTKELAGLCKIECTLHRSLNYTKGTIFAPCLNNVADDEIVSELASQSVVSVYKFTKLVDGKQIPSGVVLLSFDLYILPEKIDVSWYPAKVREYIPNPMRCKNCQLLGHTTKRCNNPTACVNCYLPPHPELQSCTRTFCANCAENHPASSRVCKKFTQQKEILTIKTQKKCSMREAKQIHKIQSPSPNIIHSYSSATAGINSTTNKETQKTTTLPSNNECSSEQQLETITLQKTKINPTPSNPTDLSVKPSISSKSNLQFNTPKQTTNTISTTPSLCPKNPNYSNIIPPNNNNNNSFLNTTLNINSYTDMLSSDSNSSKSPHRRMSFEEEL